jgi:hypothetical protein
MTRHLLTVLALLFLLPDARAQAPAIRPPARPVVPPALTPGYNPNTPPEPVYTPPGTGLPEVGQPGTHAAPVKRSPNTRALPDEFSPKREPGIWAADGEPRASTDKMPAVFGIALDYPAMATPDTKRWSDFCASTIGDTAKATGTDGLFSPIHPQLRRCLASRAYLACAFSIAEQGGATTPDARTAKAMEAHGRALVSFNCREGQGDQKNEPPFRAMLDQWRKDLSGRLTPAPTP